MVGSEENNKFDLGVKGLTMDLTALSSKITTLSQIFSYQALPLSQ